MCSNSNLKSYNSNIYLAGIDSILLLNTSLIHPNFQNSSPQVDIIEPNIPVTYESSKTDVPSNAKVTNVLTWYLTEVTVRTGKPDNRFDSKYTKDLSRAST